MRQSEPVVKLLLAAHADPNAGKANLPLAMAVYRQNSPILKLLLTNSADPNTNLTFFAPAGGVTSFPGGRQTPLSLAVAEHYADGVTEMCRFKANPNATGPGREPLLLLRHSGRANPQGLPRGRCRPECVYFARHPLLLQAVL